MRAMFNKVLFILFMSFIIALPSSFAKGKGHNKKSSPPGWEHGEKKGWESDTPPGLERNTDKVKKNQSEHKEWKDKNKNKNRKSDKSNNGNRKAKNKKSK